MTRTEGLSLYHYEGCPYCARVRQTLARLDLALELRDVMRSAAHQDALVAATGRRTVPCLRIEDDPQETRWLHESADIIRFLEARFRA